MKPVRSAPVIAPRQGVRSFRKLLEMNVIVRMKHSSILKPFFSGGYAMTLVWAVLLLPFLLPAQTTLSGTITHDGLTREYILYVPASYVPGQPAPLVFNFHGYGSNALEQMFYGDFRPIADTAGFLIVHPQGTLLNNQTHWNVGGIFDSAADDIGFTLALIDSLSATYTIDPDRIYSTGMSNGGYMSLYLACQASDRFAAVASVTGSMTPPAFNQCSPTHPMPVLQIHGTDDPIVPYDGALWTKSIPEVLVWWTDTNNNPPDPSIEDVPDLEPNDGTTAEHYTWTDGDQGVRVEHYRIIGGSHSWPGTFFTSAGTCQDFSASREIWRFFSRYDIHGTIGTSPIRTIGPGADKSIVFPNPANRTFGLVPAPVHETPFSIGDMAGRVVHAGQWPAGQTLVDLPPLPAGAYILYISGATYRLVIMD